MFAVLAVLAVASGVVVFVVDSMARATFALALSFVAVGGELVLLGSGYLASTTSVTPNVSRGLACLGSGDWTLVGTHDLVGTVDAAGKRLARTVARGGSEEVVVGRLASALKLSHSVLAVMLLVHRVIRPWNACTVHRDRAARRGLVL